MQTTIQINDKTLQILKKVKVETHSSSYDEAINKIVSNTLQTESLAGYLGKRPMKQLMKDLRDKRDRF